MAKNKKMDSLNIEAQFKDSQGSYFMMLVDGSCYRFSFIGKEPFEPITRSYYGHVLKMERKKATSYMANLYFKRNLARKSRNFLAADEYTSYIESYQKEVDRFNALWTQFKQHIAADKQKRRAAKLASKQ